MIVVTGGAGFIGCALIHELNQMGRKDIIVVDRCEDIDSNFNLSSVSYDEFIDADEFVKSRLDENLNAEVIFHMGACSSTLEKNLDYLKKNNVEYAQTLWAYCEKQRYSLSLCKLCGDLWGWGKWLR